MIIGLNATLETDFCALDSNEAWNGFQGGTLDSPSFHKMYHYELSCTIALYMLLFSH